MAKKRLTFDVEESLHSVLKARAAGRGVTLGTLCSSLLSAGVEEDIKVKDRGCIDPAMYPHTGIENLRAEALRLGEERPRGWELMLRRINMEIVRRYKVS